jgi:hypothetical protein
MFKIFMVYGTVILAIFYGCSSRKDSRAADQNRIIMSENSEHIKLRIGDFIDISLKSRGALGLQLKYTAMPDSLVEVRRMQNETVSDSLPGDAVKASFRIVAVHSGKCTVTFYETLPWEKNFEPVIQKEYLIEITE